MTERAAIVGHFQRPIELRRRFAAVGGPRTEMSAFRLAGRAAEGQFRATIVGNQ